MKKELFCLVAFSLCASVNALDIDRNERVFYYDFEDGLSLLKDSIPVNTIDGLWYYEGKGTLSDAIHPEEMTASWKRNEEIKEYCGILASEGIRTSSVLSTGKPYMHEYSESASSALEVDLSDAQDGDSCSLIFRGISIEPNTFYRMSFLVKGRLSEGAVKVGMKRGIEGAECWFSKTGTRESAINRHDISSGYAHIPSGRIMPTGQDGQNYWEVYSVLFYYTGDSVAEKYQYSNGNYDYDRWLTTDDSGNSRNMVVLPNSFSIDITFSKTATGTEIFLIDDIMLNRCDYPISAAGYTDEMVMLNFGYRTNVSTLAKSDPVGILDLPSDCLQLLVDGNPMETNNFILSNGLMYAQASDGIFDKTGNVSVMFKNPVSNPNMSIKVTDPYFAGIVDADETGLIPDFHIPLTRFSDSPHKTDVSTVKNEVIRTEYYTIWGTKIEEPTGLCLEIKTMSDGRKQTRKVLMR